MKVFKLISVIIFFFQAFTGFAADTSQQAVNSASQCDSLASKSTLLNGWYLWEPYQFNHVTPGGHELTGMDVQLVKTLAAKVGVGMVYEEVAWRQHQLDLHDGKRDIAAGATYTDARAEYVNFSVPYRFEENSLFVRNDSGKKLSFNNISEYLAQVRLQNFRLGVINGFIYADPKINAFIADSANEDIIVKFDNDKQSLEALMRGDIDGFMADRVVGAAVILNSNVGSYVKEAQLNIRTPIHLMFSKKTVPLELVDRFNQEIKKFVVSKDYKAIVRDYLYPVLLLQTINAEWFYVVGVIGTIAFAISGIAIAAKENATIFGTFLLAMLPSVGGGIMRDIIVNRDKVGIILTPSYMYYIIIVVLAGFAIIRLLDYYNHEANEDSLIGKFWNNILVLGDALGQAAFVVTGVAIAIMGKIDPIELWGPFFAFLTANGGGILRDLIRKDKVISCISGEINAEVSVIWGFAFALYLDLNAHNPNPDGIKYAVVAVVIGAFVTRLIASYWKIPNIKFRSEA